MRKGISRIDFAIAAALLGIILILIDGTLDHYRRKNEISQAITQVKNIRDLQIVHFLNGSGIDNSFAMCAISPEFPPASRPLPIDSSIPSKQSNGTYASGWKIIGFRSDIPSMFSFGVHAFDEGRSALIYAMSLPESQPLDSEKESLNIDRFENKLDELDRKKLQTLRVRTTELQEKIASINYRQEEGIREFEEKFQQKLSDTRTTCELERKKSIEWLESKQSELAAIHQKQREIIIKNFNIDEKSHESQQNYEHKKNKLAIQLQRNIDQIQKEIDDLRNSDDGEKRKEREKILENIGLEKKNLRISFQEKITVLQKQVERSRLSSTGFDRSLIGEEYASRISRLEKEYLQDQSRIEDKKTVQLLDVNKIVFQRINNKILRLNLKVKDYQLKLKDIMNNLDQMLSTQISMLKEELTRLLDEIDRKNEQQTAEILELHKRELAKLTAFCNEQEGMLILDKDKNINDLSRRFAGILENEQNTIDEIGNKIKRLLRQKQRNRKFMENEEYLLITSISLSLHAEMEDPPKITTGRAVVTRPTIQLFSRH